jgi:superkiller protein 3
VNGQVIHQEKVKVKGGQEGDPNDIKFANTYNWDLSKAKRQESPDAKKQEAAMAEARNEYERAVALNRAGNYQGALMELEPLVAKDPRQWVVHYQLGVAYEGLKRDQEAEASYKKAIELNPSNAQLYVAMGAFFIKTGRPDMARQQFDVAAQLSPDDAATSFFNMAVNFINANDFKSAIEPLKRALDADPSRLDAYYWLGVALYNSAEYKMEGNEFKTILQPGTREAFEQYLAMAPNGKYANEAREALKAIDATVPASVRVKKK